MWWQLCFIAPTLEGAKWPTPSAAGARPRRRQWQQQQQPTASLQQRQQQQAVLVTQAADVSVLDVR